MNSEAGQTPTILSYCATFLKPEMLHVYRQVSGVIGFDNLVVSRRLENRELFPHSRVMQLRKSPLRAVHRILHRYRRTRVPVSQHETSQISKIIRNEGVRLVHIYFGTEAARLLDWIPHAGVPVVVSFHGADVSDALTDEEISGIFRYARLLLHRSNSLRTALISRGAPVSKLRANPTGIPVPAEATLPVIASGQPLRLLQACRFIEKKGLDVTLQATKKLIDMGFDTQLTLAGDGPLRSKLESLAGRLNLTGRVRWTGFLTQRQLAEEYVRHDFFLHPSRETSSGDREGIPNSLLEAMACGRLVLGTRHSGIPEAVEDGVNGLLVERADAWLVAEAIKSTLQNPEHAQSIAKAARQTVVQHFSTEACIAQLMACYREAMHDG
jgi:colanic acid/amylovoran biosynthesis glycosyltransferase